MAFEEEIALLMESHLDQIGFDTILKPEPYDRTGQRSRHHASNQRSVLWRHLPVTGQFLLHPISFPRQGYLGVYEMGS